MDKRYERFSYLISNINRNLQKLKNIEMSELGLKGKAVQIIYHLYQNENGVSFSQLCMLCDEDKGAVSRTLKELVGQGYVTIQEGKGKYKNPVKLTEIGHKTGQIVASKIERYLDFGSQGINDKSREELYSSLEIVSNNLQKVIKEIGE